MKLIRLLTKGSRGTFENIFNEDLIVPKNSKIGLQNISLTPKFTVDIVAPNNTFEFSLYKNPNTNKRTVTITPGAYTEAQLRDELTIKMNSALAGDGNEWGFQWKPGFDSDKLVLNFARVTAKKIATYQSNYNVTIGATLQSSNTNDTWTHLCYPDDIFIKGCGFVDCAVNTVGEFAIGLLSGRPQISGTATFAPGSFEYSIASIFDAGAGKNYYHYYVGGADTTTLTECLVGDNVYIIIKEGKAYFTVYTAGGAEIVLGNADFNYIEDYHVGYAFKGNNAIIEPLQSFIDPFTVTTLDGTTKLDSLPDENNYHDYDNEFVEEDLGAKPAPSAASNKDRNLLFPNKALRTILGFKNQLYYQNITKGSFNAEFDFEKANLPSSLLVLLENIKLDSYDAYLKKRRNILAIIPNPAVTDETIEFHTDNPLMISMNNSAPVDLRSIIVKLVTLDNEDIVLEDGYGCTLSIVISD